MRDCDPVPQAGIPCRASGGYLATRDEATNFIDRMRTGLRLVLDEKNIHCLYCPFAPLNDGGVIVWGEGLPSARGVSVELLSACGADEGRAPEIGVLSASATGTHSAQPSYHTKSDSSIAPLFTFALTWGEVNGPRLAPSLWM